MLFLYRVFGFLYFISGIWCVIQLDAAAGFLGFTMENNSAKAEFFSVYGGLQVGLGLAMLLTSFIERYLEASLFFSWVFSFTLALFRLISFLVFGVIDDFIPMLVFEMIIALGLVWAWTKKSRSLTI